MSGLGRVYWKEVIEVLRMIIPQYDKVNRAISFGRDNDFRLKSIRDRIFPGDTILDAGSGFGNMTNLVLSEVRDSTKVIMYDPILDMLTNAKKFFSHDMLQYVTSGVFEYLPFQNNVFDVVMYGYSLRDSIELNFYLKYILKVLAFAAAGKSGLKFKTLYGTYIRWPRNSELNALLCEKFSSVKFDKAMMGGAIIVSAYK
ncbi:MAG: ubiE1 [Nitrososphaeraceae archaeon]|nr:ubiE1 [Nitrososphaeraceae archaeon]